MNIDKQYSIITLCARTKLSPEIKQRIRDILERGISFEDLIQKATWQRVYPLVAYHLTADYFKELIPDMVRAQLNRVLKNSLARNMLLQDELARLLKLFRQENIHVIVLKGSALLGTIYRDISLRPMSDLDILVSMNNLNKAERIAIHGGYITPISGWHEEQIRKYGQHIPHLVHPEKKIILEIHHHIVGPRSPYRFNIDAFWEKSREIEIGLVPSLAFAPEHTIIHITIKFLLDRRYQSACALGQLTDISEIIQHYGDAIDWELIKETALKNGLASGVHFVLYACERLLGTPIPSNVFEYLKPTAFDDSSAKLFIQRRVLDTKPWLAHGLTDLENNGKRQGNLTAILNRIFSLYKKDEHGKENIFFKQTWKILSRIIQGAQKPSKLKEDLLLDRWLSDLQN